ncbi:uncharacterized [Tachysurus ichikawai]
MTALLRHSDKCVFSRRFSAKIRRRRQDPERSARCLLSRDFVLFPETRRELVANNNVAQRAQKCTVRLGLAPACSAFEAFWRVKTRQKETLGL